VFAHKVLPSLFFADPHRFIELLKSGGDEFLRLLWDKVGQDLGKQNGSMSGSMSCVVEQLDASTELALITLPEPQGIAEAYFVAVVLRPSAPPQEGITRFFTLEKGASLDESPRTVFCEWTADEAHLNYGDGSVPTVTDFRRSIRENLGSL
jgi:hypothetical protein